MTTIRLQDFEIPSLHFESYRYLGPFENIAVGFAKRELSGFLKFLSTASSGLRQEPPKAETQN
jgi:hypothetical protein